MINKRKKILIGWLDEDQEDEKMMIDCDETSFSTVHAFLTLDTMVEYLLENGYHMHDILRFVNDGVAEEKPLN